MDYNEIKNIMKDMGESNLDSLMIEFPEGVKVSMTKNTPKEAINQEPIKETVNTTTENTAKENCAFIKSPIVGTFYASPSPDKEPFVKVGDTVAKGDVVCIIEAMKLINEITSDIDGVIQEILVENDSLVDFGKPLFKVI